MNGLPIQITGVTFETVRRALTAIFFEYVGMTDEAYEEALTYVVPMQHNYENPIKPKSDDTWIEYWIDEDDRMTQDYRDRDGDTAVKVAAVTVRFLGVQAEAWAKSFHHLTKREAIPYIFGEHCNAQQLEYTGKIVPKNIDYFGVSNTVIGFDIVFHLVYHETLILPKAERLQFISIAPGEIITGDIGG